LQEGEEKGRRQFTGERGVTGEERNFGAVVLESKERLSVESERLDSDDGKKVIAGTLS